MIAFVCPTIAILQHYAAKWLLLIIISFAITPIAKTDEMDSCITDSAPNGRYWNALKEKEKSSFVIGIREGLGIISDRALHEIKIGIKNKTHRDALKANRDTIHFVTKAVPEGLILDKIIVDINNFYSNKSNLNIPISTAYLKVVTEVQATKKEKTK